MAAAPFATYMTSLGFDELSEKFRRSVRRAYVHYMSDNCLSSLALERSAEVLVSDVTLDFFNGFGLRRSYPDWGLLDLEEIDPESISCVEFSQLVHSPEYAGTSYFDDPWVILFDQFWHPKAAAFDTELLGTEVADELKTRVSRAFRVMCIENPDMLVIDALDSSVEDIWQALSQALVPSSEPSTSAVGEQARSDLAPSNPAQSMSLSGQ